MRKNYIIPIIVIFVVVALVACALILLKKPADDGYLEVCTHTFDEITLDLGRYKGEMVKGVEYFQARIEDIDAFIDDVKKSPYFDEKLYFDVGENHYWEQYFYLIFENRIFLLNVSENYIELRPVEELFTKLGYDDSTGESFEQIAPLYTDKLQYNDKTEQYMPSRWFKEDATFESLQYLYQKLVDIAKIEDGKIYLRGLELSLADLPEKPNLSDNYTFVIYQDENGEIMVSPIY